LKVKINFQRKKKTLKRKKEKNTKLNDIIPLDITNNLFFL
jgi:hypothetical protein